MAPPPAATLSSGRSESRRGRRCSGREREARTAGEPALGAAASGRDPSRPPDLEKETEALAEDGDRGAVPVGVEEGGACRRGMLWAEKPEREVPPPASRELRLPRGRE
ncbi:unnamed protein product [Miscanthus lutarioriparius]|uniref:Uncharacterized protein n=1 Tax=Miscanthus lutarioriparius TaxID=422564 RepID=A0A811RF52_9POAL|nr:unnamed protein product [Miscanthus lutarioriparius]